LLLLQLMLLMLLLLLFLLFLLLLLMLIMLLPLVLHGGWDHQQPLLLLIFWLVNRNECGAVGHALCHCHKIEHRPPRPRAPEHALLGRRNGPALPRRTGRPN